MLGESLKYAVNVTGAIENAGKNLGLQINANETKIMEIFDCAGEHLKELKNLMYGRLEDFKYLDAMPSTKNEWACEIGIRLNKARKRNEYYALTKYLRSELLS